MADFTYLSCGAGVQSGTIVEMIVEGELSIPNLILFADTGDEPQYVYDHVSYLSERLESIGSELRIVSAGNLVEDLLSPQLLRFASIPVYSNAGKNGKSAPLRRQCTSEYKIEPIEKELKSELVKKGMAKKDKRGVTVEKGIQVEAWLGISLDEVQRMKPNRTKWITNRWPLIDKRMTRHDCRIWLQKRGLPIPGRSSCRICPYHDDSYWRAMRNSANGDWIHAVEIDKSLRDGRGGYFRTATKGDIFLHKSCVPLDEVDLRTPEEKGQMSFFDTYETVCDGGYCFV